MQMPWHGHGAWLGILRTAETCALAPHDGALTRKSNPARDWICALLTLLDQFQEWRDNLPSSLANSPTGEVLDAVLELRGYVEELQAVELPKGFGRD